MPTAAACQFLPILKITSTCKDSKLKDGERDEVVDGGIECSAGPEICPPRLPTRRTRSLLKPSAIMSTEALPIRKSSNKLLRGGHSGSVFPFAVPTFFAVYPASAAPPSFDTGMVPGCGNQKRERELCESFRAQTSSAHINFLVGHYFIIDKSKNRTMKVTLVGLLLLVGVEAKITRDDTVVCHSEHSMICVGDVEIAAPSLMEMCQEPPNESNCTVMTDGGWMWTMRFVRGGSVPVGSAFLELSQAERTAALSGLSVVVTLDESNNCTIVVGKDVGEEACDSCSICGNDGNDDGNSFSFSADCTNVETGRLVDCEPVLPIFYPLDGTATADKMEDSSSSTFAPSKSNPFQTVMTLCGFAVAFLY